MNLNNFRYKNYRALLSLIFLPNILQAQVNAGGDSLIKPNFNGNLLNPRTEKRQQAYVTNSNPIVFKYQSSVLKPIVFNEEQSKDFNYLNLLGGTLGGINIEGITRIAQPKNTFTIGGVIERNKSTNLQHNGRYGIHSIWNSNYKNNNLLAQGGYQFLNNIRYGHQDAIMQRATNAHAIDAGITLLPKQDSTTSISPFINLQYTLLDNISEQLFHLGLLVHQKINPKTNWIHKGQYHLDQLTSGSINNDNSLLELQSQYVINRKKSQLALGGIIAHTDKSWKALPNITWHYVYHKKIKLNAQYGGQAQLNSLRAQYLINPFTQFSTNFKNSWIRNLQVGLSGTITPQLTLGASVNAQRQTNYATFVTDSNYSLTQHYIPTVDLIYYHINGLYKINDDAFIGINVNRINTNKIIPYLPKNSANLYSNWAITKKLKIMPSINFIGERATVLAPSTLNNPLKNGLDCSTKAYYQIGKRVQLMAAFNNILNAQYQLWQGYNVYNRQLLVGAQLKNNL
jgi:hypothetical protein